MADNSVALGRNNGPDIFADDDPLAELARIAGYDDRSARKPQPAAPARREPAFNLEDELLREFERYDSPRAAADEPLPEPVEQVADVPRQQHVIQQVHNVPSADPFADMNLPVELPPTRTIVQQASGPDFSSWLGATGAQQVPLPVSMKVEPSLQPQSEMHAVSQPQMVEVPGYGAAVDLEAELESSLSVAPRASVPSRPAPKAYTPGFQMPLANFNRAANPPRPASEPVREHELLSDFDLADEVAVATPDHLSASPTELLSPAIDEPRFSAVQSAPATPVSFSALEEHIFDLEGAAPTRVSGHQPTVSASTSPELVRREPVLSPDPAPLAADMDREADLLSDDEFDLALDDLELDLTDLVKHHVTEEVASQGQEVVSKPQAFAASYAAPVAAVVAPSAVADAGPISATEDEFDFGGGDEAFDPAQLAEADEMPEPVPDLDVPELPVEEPEQTPVHHHSDYDLDLDAELASLLDTSAPSAAAAAAATGVAATASIAVSRRRRDTDQEQDQHLHVAQQPTLDGPNAIARDKAVQDFNEFERALEEDFRRSLANPLPQRVAEVGGEEDVLPFAEHARRSPGRWMMPLSVAGFVVIVGASGYAWWASDKGRIISSGAPVVIAADTTPVKVAPENPGGKTVPNQDKAVYDRVAGGAPKDPKQATLISTDEQPMDVVQKTLVPENLPLEGLSEEASLPATPVNDTKDPRLLPQQAQANGAAEDPLSVMPRKVKTMVVRPDGSLVEQQVTKPTAVASVQVPATSVKSEKIPSQPALAEPNAKAVLPGNVADQKPTDIASVNVAKVSTMTGTSQAAASASAAPVGTPAKPGTPIPTARPAEQPVKVVASVSEQGTVKPAPQPAAAPIVTASVAPAASASANGGYYIQVASLPSEAEAQKSYKSITAKFGNVIAGRGVDIAKAEIAGKGTFYRVRIPAGSKDDAVALCEKYRAAGGTCLVAR